MLVCFFLARSGGGGGGWRFPLLPLDETLLISSGSVDGNKEVESEASGSVMRSRCYLVNCALPGGPECDTRSFLLVENITQVSRKWLRKCICSMMNLGKTSTIFMGVLKEGIVKGVKLNKEQVLVVTNYYSGTPLSKSTEIMTPL